MRAAAVALVFFLALFFLQWPSSLQAANETVGRQLKAELDRFGPSYPDSSERQKALLEIDNLFMNDSLEPLRILLKETVSSALAEISTSKMPSTTVWYFWNMGYIAKTKSHTLGFDIADLQLAPLNQDQKRALAASLDILFVSHVDGPHIDRDIVSSMRADSFVVCPSEDVSFFDTVLDRKCTVVGLKAGETQQVGPAKGQAYLGDHGEGGPNMRCFMVSIDGVKLLQTGDQRSFADWMEKVGRRGLDVLMFNPLWEYANTVAAVKTMKPTYALPGTLYDMSHPKETWEGFPYAFQVRKDVGSNVFPMFFGEKLRTRPSSSPMVTRFGLIGMFAAVGALAAAVWVKSKSTKEDPRRRPAEQDCQKRYVPEVCLTCRHCALRGGGAYCLKHNIALEAEP